MIRRISILVLTIALMLVAGLMEVGVIGTAFSDTGISTGNTITAGMNLKVSDGQGNKYDNPKVPVLVAIDNGWPECQKVACFEVHNNGGDGQPPPVAYLHINNINCSTAEPKVPYAYINCTEGGECIDCEPPYTGCKPMTEPEYVAECGGIAGEDVNGNLVTVPGLGCCWGETCELAQAINVSISKAGPYTADEDPPNCSEVPTGNWSVLDLSAYDQNGDGKVTLNELECEQIELGELPGCNSYWIEMTLELQDVSEDDLIAQGVLADPGTGYGWFNQSIPAEMKWNDWPTNALMYDMMEFDISFGPL